MVAYIILRKWDIFQINSANLVNVRGAQTFNENPLARQSAGAVEVRVLDRTLPCSCSAAGQQPPAALKSTLNPSSWLLFVWFCAGKLSSKLLVESKVPGLVCSPN